MGSESIIAYLTTSQYSLFFGVSLIIFGWMEKKEKLGLSGQVIFLLLGVLAAWIVSTNHIEITDPNMSIISKPVKALLFFKLCIGFGVLSLISVILGVMKSKWNQYGMIVSSVIALALFFMALNILQMPK